MNRMHGTGEQGRLGIVRSMKIVAQGIFVFFAVSVFAISIAACEGTTTVKTVVVEKPVMVEVQREVTVEVERVVEVPVTVEVLKEVMVPVEKAVTVEVVKEIVIEKMVEVEKEVPVEVIKEIEVEVVKEVQVEVPVTVIVEKEVQVASQTIVETVIVEKEVVKEVEVPVTVVVEKTVETTKEIVVAPTQPPSPTPAIDKVQNVAKSISAGGSFHLRLARERPEAVCWGYNESGQASPLTGRFTEISAGRWSRLRLA